MKHKREAMRKHMAQRLEQRRKRRTKTPAKKEERRRWPWFLMLLLLLPCLLGPCTEEAAVAEPQAPPPAVEVVAEQVEPPAPAMGQVARQDRPEMHTKAPPALPWIASFRMQVAARSPRLAICFVGVTQPGALKWTTSVEPAGGVVSDDTIEPTLSSAPLTRSQRACVLTVLSEPAYNLTLDDAPSTPSRVGLVLEF